MDLVGIGVLASQHATLTPLTLAIIGAILVFALAAGVLAGDRWVRRQEREHGASWDIDERGEGDPSRPSWRETSWMDPPRPPMS